MTAAPTRPALRWHGGKWLLAPWIIENLPPHRIYVEPFGGAASVLIRKPAAYAEVYNDLDGDVVDMFRVLRDPPQAARLIEQVALTPFSREEQADAYEQASDPVERARRLIIRSFMGFGSNGHQQKTGFRANSNRSGTTPSRDWANYPDGLAQVASRFTGVVVERRPAVDVMAAHDSSDTLHYVDPPYMPETRDAGGDYAHEMTIEQHAELLTFLTTLRGMVVLSGYPTALYDDGLAGWDRIERRALADGARERIEVLWLNPAAAQGRRQGNLFGAAA